MGFISSEAWWLNYRRVLDELFQWREFIKSYFVKYATTTAKHCAAKVHVSRLYNIFPVVICEK